MWISDFAPPGLARTPRNRIRERQNLAPRARGRLLIGRLDRLVSGPAGCGGGPLRPSSGLPGGSGEFSDSSRAVQALAESSIQGVVIRFLGWGFGHWVGYAALTPPTTLNPVIRKFANKLKSKTVCAQVHTSVCRVCQCLPGSAREC